MVGEGALSMGEGSEGYLFEAKMRPTTKHAFSPNLGIAALTKSQPNS